MPTADKHRQVCHGCRDLFSQQRLFPYFISNFTWSPRHGSWQIQYGGTHVISGPHRVMKQLSYSYLLILACQV